MVAQSETRIDEPARERHFLVNEGGDAWIFLKFFGARDNAFRGGVGLPLFGLFGKIILKRPLKVPHVGAAIKHHHRIEKRQFIAKDVRIKPHCLRKILEGDVFSFAFP